MLTVPGWLVALAPQVNSSKPWWTRSSLLQSTGSVPDHLVGTEGCNLLISIGVSKWPLLSWVSTVGQEQAGRSWRGPSGWHLPGSTPRWGGLTGFRTGVRTETPMCRLQGHPAAAAPQGRGAGPQHAGKGEHFCFCLSFLHVFPFSCHLFLLKVFLLQPPQHHRKPHPLYLFLPTGMWAGIPALCALAQRCIMEQALLFRALFKAIKILKNEKKHAPWSLNSSISIICCHDTQLTLEHGSKADC